MKKIEESSFDRRVSNASFGVCVLNCALFSSRANTTAGLQVSGQLGHLASLFATLFRICRRHDGNSEEAE